MGGKTPCYYSTRILLIIASWLYLQFYRGYHYQTWQDGRLICTDLTQHVMMTSTQLNHLTNVYGFISTPISLINTKLCWMVDQHALIFPCRYDDVTAVRSPDQCLWLYLDFQKPYNNQSWEDDRPACPDLFLQV